jgi:serine/threonine protein kinase
MSQMLRCPNGHEWNVPTEVLASSAGSTLSCPVCGVSAQTVSWPPTGSPPTFNQTTSGSMPAGPPAMPVIAGYEVLEEIGQGGMGIVYCARQLARDRIVALKVIRRERLAHPDIVQRFRREAQAAARLAHPNIVALYEADQAGDLHYLAMEYVPGLTLQRLLERSGAMNVWQACDCVRQTALALQHAADQALVHRDIKPSNIMIIAPPQGPIPLRPAVKVLDVGVARLYALHNLPEDSLTTLTRDGAVIGTPDYIAPEQLENPHSADIRADLYSLGCTFYHLLTGQVPFPGGTLIQKLDRQRWQTPPSVDQLRQEVPSAVAAIVRRLMAKHPDDRYRTPAELSSALEQLGRSSISPADSQLAPLHETSCCRGHAGPVVALAFAPDGTLLSAGSDRTLRHWSGLGYATGQVLGQSPHEISCLAIVPDSGLLLAGQGASVRIWDPQRGVEVQRLSGHIDAVRSIAVDSQGRFVLTGSADRSLRLWDLRTGREMQRLAGNKAEIVSAALSADGRHALSGSRDQTLRLWELSSGRLLCSFPVPRGPVLGVAFAPGERAVVSAHFDTTLRLWEIDSERELRRFSGHRQMVVCLAVSPGRLISGSHDGTARIWDIDSGAELWCCRGHSAPLTSVALHPDGKTLASASADETIRLWQLPR